MSSVKRSLTNSAHGVNTSEVRLSNRSVLEGIYFRPYLVKHFGEVLTEKLGCATVEFEITDQFAIGIEPSADEQLLNC